jgi:hypothetical protein
MGETKQAPRISTVARPYLLTFHASGHTYPLTSEEAQRLLDEYPAVRVNSQRVVLQGHNTPRTEERTTIRPATLGGGPAFIIEL